MLSAILSILAGLGGLILAGPRVPVKTTLRPLKLPPDLDRYLRETEATYANLQPGAEKRIIWADPASKEKTPLSIVYLHGFTASCREIDPVPTWVAQALGLNLFYSRLTGHGQDGAALGQATVNDWLNDGAEAVAIGRRLGDRVVLMGTSTGASLTVWLASQSEFADQIAALILISPNFGLHDWRSRLLLWPWGYLVVQMLLGRRSRWQPLNQEHEKYWTLDYPSAALLPMMGLVNLARTVDIGRITASLLMIYSPQDRVISVPTIEQLYPRFGSLMKGLLPITTSQDPANHVLAGDIVSPNNNSRVTKAMITFLRPVLWKNRKKLIERANV